MRPGATMTDWSGLRDAYGSAADVPELLAQITPDARSKVWQNLWSCLCHQGTAYSASFAALPILLEAAKVWKPKERTMPILLAAAIISFPTSYPNALDPDDIASAVKSQFHKLCLDSLSCAELPDYNFIYFFNSF